ncbi:hypothetical protein CKM354_000129400 [Cercospora kikuchii]|uniref:BTB domain-containing protein n=1 Tax=Cercospora kikuchii TaxID=84275 RepID=A0A9P3F8K6_9PEZI|nr:uncharacterized protein CKM354_000129400 [Cercospora kikuchii]GIZ37863.1 hypothetical protein CKM354_000129400 [Cercospora kikuchii]
MAASYREIATTKPFRFIVGSNAVEFFVHPAVIVQHSEPLAKLMHGDMREAREGQARIEEVDENTFARFVEFCYTKDYPAAEHAIVLDAASIEQEKQPSEVAEVNSIPAHGNVPRAAEDEYMDVAEPALGFDDNWGDFSFPSKKKAKKAGYKIAAPSQWESAPATSSRKRTVAWKDFQNMSWNSQSNGSKVPADQARPNKEACEEYTDVFLSHARLYVFADTYAIEPLRVLSLQKLHKVLGTFTLFKGREEDIATLLQYTYQNTAERDAKMDELRKLVIKYVSCNVEKLRSNETFKKTLAAENSSSVDLIEMLLPRLD